MTDAERTQRLRDKRRRDGMVRIDRWVPKALAERIRAYIDRLTKGSEK